MKLEVALQKIRAGEAYPYQKSMQYKEGLGF